MVEVTDILMKKTRNIQKGWGSEGNQTIRMSYAKQRGHSRFHINAWELRGRKKTVRGFKLDECA